MYKNNKQPQINNMINNNAHQHLLQDLGANKTSSHQDHVLYILDFYTPWKIDDGHCNSNIIWYTMGRSTVVAKGYIDRHVSPNIVVGNSYRYVACPTDPRGGR